MFYSFSPVKGVFIQLQTTSLEQKPHVPLLFLQQLYVQCLSFLSRSCIVSVSVHMFCTLNNKITMINLHDFPCVFRICWSLWTKDNHWKYNWLQVFFLRFAFVSPLFLRDYLGGKSSFGVQSLHCILLSILFVLIWDGSSWYDLGNTYQGCSSVLPLCSNLVSEYWIF